jgi:putrescine transport system permease protein
MNWRAVFTPRSLLLLLPTTWLLLFLLLPMLIVLKISLAEPLIASPPYTPLVDWHTPEGPRVALSFGNYRFLLEDPLYLDALCSSLVMAGLATLLCLLLAYPMAYCMAAAPVELRAFMVLAVVLPFWTSFLLRVYAWIGLLSGHGPISQTLLWLGLIDQPWSILKTQTAVLIGIVYTYLPFMVLPIYAALDRFDGRLIEAAQDLGARPWRSFFSITWPLSLPGVAAGSALVFIPVVGEFVIPDLLGGADTLMLGRVLWGEFFNNRAWPLAAAVAVCMLLLVAALGGLKRWLAPRRGFMT